MRVCVFYSLLCLLTASLTVQAAEERSYYKILGISESATQEEIKTAWKKAASHLHPDKNPNDGGEGFKEARRAFDILSNPLTRKRYDQERGRIYRKSRASTDRHGDAPSSSTVARSGNTTPSSASSARRGNTHPSAYRGSAKPTVSSVSVNLRSAQPLDLTPEVDSAMAKLNNLHSQYRYSQGYKDDHYRSVRRHTDRDLKRSLERLLNTSFVRRREIIIPEEILHFPETVSLLAEFGVDFASASPARENRDHSLLEAALRRREPEVFRALLRHNPALINKKTKKGTPLFNLVLKKVKYSRDEAARHKGRPSCPPSCYESWQKTAAEWNGLAHKVLSERFVDLTQRDAKGEPPLLTAIRLDLEISNRMLQMGGEGYLTIEDRSQLKPLARQTGSAHLERRLRANGGGGNHIRLPTGSNDEASSALRHYRAGAAQSLGKDSGDALEGPSSGGHIPLSGPEKDGGGEDCSPGFFRKFFGKSGK